MTLGGDARGRGHEVVRFVEQPGEELIVETHFDDWLQPCALGDEPNLAGHGIIVSASDRSLQNHFAI